MRFSTSCCAVCEDCSVESFKNTAKEIARCAFVDFLLGDVFVEDSVEAKAHVFDSFALWENGLLEFSHGVVLGGVEDPEDCQPPLSIVGNKRGREGSLTAFDRQRLLLSSSSLSP